MTDDNKVLEALRLAAEQARDLLGLKPNKPEHPIPTAYWILENALTELEAALTSQEQRLHEGDHVWDEVNKPNLHYTYCKLCAKAGHIIMQPADSAKGG